MTDRKLQALQNLADRPGTSHEGELALALLQIPKDPLQRDKRIMAELSARGIPPTPRAYCDEWQRQFGGESLEFGTPKPERIESPAPKAQKPERIESPAPKAQVGFGELHPGAFVVPQNPDPENDRLRKELGKAESRLMEFYNFWERAAQAVGLEHPPRLIDPIPPERQYQRQMCHFDDGWRAFTADDILRWLAILRKRGRV